MSRWGKPRKNKKFIDPRYFMDEKMERLDEVKTTIDPLGEGGPGEANPIVLRGVMNALRFIALDVETRSLAVEAAVAARL